MTHKSILFLIFIILIINYFSIGFSGFYESFEEYRNKLLSKKRNINYNTLYNNIETKYFKCFQHYNEYVKPIQDKTNLNSVENIEEDSTFLHKTNIKDNGITFENYLEYWWNSEESEDELLNRVCNYIQNKYPKKYIRFGK